MEIVTIPQGGVTSPQGFLAGAVAAGLRASSTEPDLGLLFSKVPCTAAGVFTRNRLPAAPVVLTRERLKGHSAQAIVANAGCANAATGEAGMAAAQEMAALAARKLGIAEEAVLVASTGVIGVPLPMEKLRSGLGKISLSERGGYNLARAIMTTDAWPKERAVSFEVAGCRFTIGGTAKGAGMIHPDLATMLAFITTDAAVEASFLEQALRRAVAVSFNMLTVDGDTSPNDIVVVLANGLAGNRPIAQGTPGAARFQRTLTEVCIYLARSIACNAEGASHLIEITVEGAASPAQARRAARTIAGSNLVKTAVHGADPNWGRVLAALGRSGVAVDADKIELYLEDLCLMKAGQPQPMDGELARAMLRKPGVRFRVGLGLGRGRATAWGCDLSEEYVRLNSAYTT